MSSVVAVIAGFFSLHCLYVAATRFSKLRDIEARYGGRYSFSEEEKKTTGKPRMIDSYRGVRDAQRIARLASQWDTPFMFSKSIQFALFRTYGIKTISSLLLHTGQLSKAENAGRRYVDTAALIVSFMIYPLPKLDYTDEDQPPAAGSWETNREDPSDPRSAIALGRVNYLHGRWKNKISNDDLLYTLSVFVIEPPKWNASYEWRKMTRLEEEALFALFYHIGRCMGIENIPETYEELIEWSTEYERVNFVYTQSNADVAEHTVNLLLSTVPSFAHPFAKQVIASLMDEGLRGAMGYKRPPTYISGLTKTLLWVRALVVRLTFLPRTKAHASVPIGSDEKGAAEFSVDRFLSTPTGMCPVSGALATEGKTCPVGEKAAVTNTGPYRMELKFYDFEPFYARPHRKWSLAWAAESAQVMLGLLAPENRRGSAKLRAPTLPQQPANPVQGLGGFRLEELGPKGLEMKGRDIVLKDAVRMQGRPIEGPWAFTA